MAVTDPARLTGETESDSKPPPVTSLRDLTIIEYVTFYLGTHDEEVYFGQSSKNKRDMTLAQYSAALEHISDDEIYPEIPTDVQLKIAPESLDDSSAFIKRPDLNSYEIMKGSNYIPKALLDKTLIMEQTSKSSHPNIVGYYGCRLDKIKFIEALELAVDYLHSLGLAHNDINPENIMVKDRKPVLIDFGSSQPFGTSLQSLGTEGWCEELLFDSEKKHDTYSLKKLREWLQKPEWPSRRLRDKGG